VEKWEELIHQVEDAEVLVELGEEGDKESLEELRGLLPKLSREVEELEIRSLFQENFDARDAIVSIHAGAGGTEACDWVEMLLRMYLRWAEEHGYRTEVIDSLSGEEAGLKNVTFLVRGKFAYGHLKSERGVHRLVRISPFDFNRRRHTSFASVDVIPSLPEDIKIELDPKDLRIETFRASGPGGQHVNVTDSAVRISHIPTGIVAQCQSERSQIQNKERAMEILKARLFELEERKRREKLEKLRGERREIAWGSQIRSYILHPYNLIKDHRTGYEEPRVEKVLDGEIDDFILAYLKSISLERS
jgi:peptide chain release factor 2